MGGQLGLSIFGSTFRQGTGLIRGSRMNSPTVYFLHDDSDTQVSIIEFLKPFYQLVTEALSFSFEGIKTKELFAQIDMRLEITPFDFLLIQHDGQLELFDAQKRRIRIDFDSDKINYNRKVIAKDPFLRAIGQNRKNVLDISAGLAIDSVFLSQHGHKVTAIERNPLLYTLLSHAKERSEYLKIRSIDFKFAQAKAFVQSISRDDFDCIYFDPMFPDKVRSALPKQEMVLFRQLVGSDDDAAEILESLLKTGSRIVVKRPAYSEPIGFKPTNAFESKLLRFDIYENYK